MLGVDRIEPHPQDHSLERLLEREGRSIGHAVDQAAIAQQPERLGVWGGQRHGHGIGLCVLTDPRQGFGQHIQ